MSEFQVVVFNTIAEGFTPEDVERNLSKYLKIDSGKSSKLLNREKTIIKKGISSSDIGKYERVLDKCGISYEIEPIQNVPSSQAPLSMEEQNSEEKNEIKSDKNISKHFIPTDLSYDEIPFYRKRCFFFPLLLLFPIAPLLVCLTGSIYANIDSKVYKFPKIFRFAMVFMIFVTMFNAVVLNLNK